MAIRLGGAWPMDTPGRGLKRNEGEAIAELEASAWRKRLPLGERGRAVVALRLGGGFAFEPGGGVRIGLGDGGTEVPKGTERKATEDVRSNHRFQPFAVKNVQQFLGRAARVFLADLPFLNRRQARIQYGGHD